MESLQLYPQANEVFLFHGTKSNIVDFIIQQGFEERIAKDEGIFGAGIYFAENSSKSDEYITPDSNGLCKLFLCRVCLGTPFVTTRSLKSIRRPPCRFVGSISEFQKQKFIIDVNNWNVSNIIIFL